MNKVASARQRSPWVSQQPKQIVFLLLPGFSLATWAAAIEPLRIANDLAGRELYQTVLIGARSSKERSSGGIDLSVEMVGKAPPNPETIIVCGGVFSESFNDRNAIEWLRKQARTGCRIGALSGGVFLLAKLGLLYNRRFSLHWTFRQAFSEKYPQLQPAPDNFVIDGKILTCAGGIASLEFMLELIDRDHGRFLSGQVADQFLVTSNLDSGNYFAQYRRAGVTHQKVLKAIQIMESHRENLVSLAKIAESVGLSARQLQRLFLNIFKQSPNKFYLTLRLRHARELILHSSMSITEISCACGFKSASNFSKVYREQYRQPPRATRAGLAQNFLSSIPIALPRRDSEKERRARPE